MKKLKLKKNCGLKIKERPLESEVYIGDYPWPNAYFALKGFYLNCLFAKKMNVKNAVYVSGEFIQSVISGSYDRVFPEIGPIVNHPQKRQLKAIEGASFNHLLKTDPTLLAGALRIGRVCG